MTLPLLLALGAWMPAAQAKDSASGLDFGDSAPVFLAGCTSLQALTDFALPTELILEKGGEEAAEVLALMERMDQSAALLVGISVDAQGRTHLNMSVGVNDVDQVIARIGSEGKGTLAQDGPGAWTLTSEDGSKLRIRADKGRLFFKAEDVDLDSPPSYEAAKRANLSSKVLVPDVPGCLFQASLGAMGGNARVPDGTLRVEIFQDNLDHVRMEIGGIPAIGPYLGMLGDSPPRRAPSARSVETPMMVFRINVDPEDLIKALLDAPLPMSNPETVGEAKKALRKARRGGINFSSGAEMALFAGDGGQPSFAVVVPLRRPWNAKRFPKRLAHGLKKEGVEHQWIGDMLVVSGPAGKNIFLSADRDHAVIAMDEGRVMDVLSGQGQPWIAAENQELASTGGVFVAMDFGSPTIAALMAMAPGGASSQLPDDLGLVSLAVGEGSSGGLLVDMVAVGLHDMVLAKMSEALEEEAAEEEMGGVVGGVLGGMQGSADLQGPQVDMLRAIAELERQSKDAGGAYVAYSGGPRDLDQLNGQAVAWEGIPALQLAGVETACRYEVTLDSLGFTARAVCDEDGDGVLAIYLVGPDGVVSRVTPPEIR